MPRITVSWLEGRNIEQKRKIVTEFTKTMVEIAGVSADAVTVYFHDLPKNNIGKGGKLFSDR